MSPRPPRIAHVVSHTHWDREWYRSVDAFGVRMTRVVREVLDLLESGRLTHFLLDGQTILLEDHLALYPEDAARIRRQAERGALALGPWYVLPDEFLVSAEAHVRNLQLGHQVAARFGPVQKVGYLPDAFGHIAQMPQLLRQAGIDSALFQRGSGAELDRLGAIFDWQAPDGSQVTAVYLCGGYGNAAALGLAGVWDGLARRWPDPARVPTQIAEALTAWRTWTASDVVLLMNGCDHLPPQPELPELLDAAREAFPETTFVCGPLADFVDAVRDEPRGVHQGELRGGRVQLVLSGVWSTRVYLKQANDRCQQLLTGWLEPLAAYTSFVHGRPHPEGLLAMAWRRLLANHPHDSICGCSIDLVHREMMARFDGLGEMAETAIDEELRALVPLDARDPARDGEVVLGLFNPLPEPVTAVVERVVILPAEWAGDGVGLVDAAGREVPTETVDVHRFERPFWVDPRAAGDVRQQLAQVHLLGRVRAPADGGAPAVAVHLRARVVLPPLGHRVYRLTTGASSVEGQVTDDGTVLQNRWLCVTPHPDGSLDLLDRRTGRRWERLNRLVCARDDGDSYDAAPGGWQVEAESTEDRPTPHPGVRGGRLAVDRWLPCCRLRLPASGDDAPSPILVHVGLRLDEALPLVHVRVRLENQGRQHRLRAHFDAGVETDTITSEGHFAVEPRPVDPPAGSGWRQPPAPTVPQQGWSLLTDPRGGLAVLARGLHEVEPIRDEAGRVGLALTLLRCVGWLSRDDLPTRNHEHAGPMIETPEAQCPGPHVFDYAIAPLPPDTPISEVLRLDRRWRTAPRVVQGVAEGAVPGGPGLLDVSPGDCPTTAIRRHPERPTLVVRLYNPTAESRSERLTVARPLAGAWSLALLEQRRGELAVDGRQVDVALGPHRIETVELAFDR